MEPLNTEKPTSALRASALRGRGQLWVAVGCFSLSNLLSAAWVWSLIAMQPR